jgi:hypothetical protein
VAACCAPLSSLSGTAPSLAGAAAGVPCSRNARVHNTATMREMQVQCMFMSTGLNSSGQTTGYLVMTLDYSQQCTRCIKLLTRGMKLDTSAPTLMVPLCRVRSMLRLHGHAPTATLPGILLKKREGGPRCSASPCQKAATRVDAGLVLIPSRCVLTQACIHDVDLH